MIKNTLRNIILNNEMNIVIAICRESEETYRSLENTRCDLKEYEICCENNKKAFQVI